MKQAPAIGFHCRTSWLLIVVTIAMAVLAIFALQLVRGTAWLHHLLFFVVVAYLVLTLRGLARPPIVSVLWRSDGGVDLKLRDGAPEPGRDVQGIVSAARVVGPLIVLTLRWPPRERTHLWLLPDNLDADTRRRLRMRLGAAGHFLASGNADSH
ncbi:MAG: protein YgfX [Rhodanobacteraceae bacterium]